MGFPFGQELFRGQPEFFKQFDFVDVLQGQAYIDFFGGILRPEAEAIVEAGLQTGDDADISLTGNTIAAQTFTPTQDIWISKIEFYGRRSGSTQTIVYITRTDGSDLPDFDELISFTAITSGNLPTSNDWAKSEFDNYVKLKKDVVYALAIDCPSGTWIWRADSSSPPYTGGSLINSVDAGANWTADTSQDLLFRLSGFTTNPYTLLTTVFDTDIDTFETPTVSNLTPDSYFKRGDIDYDLTVGTTMLLNGKAVINLTTNGNEGGNAGAYHIIAKIKKDDGTTETTLGTGQGRNIQMVNGGAYVRHGILIDVSSKTTRLVKGDILRITIEMWAATVGSILSFKLFNDPKSLNKHNIQIASSDGESNYSGTTTDLHVILPFKLDV